MYPDQVREVAKFVIYLCPTKNIVCYNVNVFTFNTLTFFTQYICVHLWECAFLEYLLWRFNWWNLNHLWKNSSVFVVVMHEIPFPLHFLIVKYWSICTLNFPYQKFCTEMLLFFLNKHDLFGYMSLNIMRYSNDITWQLCTAVDA